MIEDLEAAFRAEDVDGVRRELAALDASGLAGARRWATKLKLDRWPGERRQLVYAVLVIRLLTPQQVIDRLRRRGWPREGAADLIDEVLARDPEWRAGLVRVAGSLGVPADGVGLTGWALYQVVRAVSREDGLDVTWGELLVRGWLDHCFQYTFDERLRRVARSETPERVRAEGHLTAFPLAFAHRGLSEFVGFAPAVVTLVEDGDLARADVVARCLAALDSPGRPSDQKTVADVVAALRVSGAEVPGGLARLQQLLATCHGQVTSVLLPVAIDLLTTADDVAELAGTVMSRPEMKQRTDLLRALIAKDTRSRLGDQAVRAGLEVLAESTDAVLQGKAVAALEKLGGAVPTSSAATPRLGLWEAAPADTRPKRNRFHELASVDDDNAVGVIRHAVRMSPAALEPFYEPTALSLVVRWAWQDGADAVRKRLDADDGMQPARNKPTWLGRLLRDWLDGELHAPPGAGWLARYRSGARGMLDQWSPAATLGERHVRESLVRAGRVPFLLSTPTRPDAGLDLDALVDRLGRSADVGFGPIDLLQAILRLRPVDPARAVELEGLPVVPPDLSAGTTTSVTDAVAYVRDAVAAGRFIPPFVTSQRLREEGWLDLDQPPAGFWLAMLPVDPADLGSDVDELALVARPFDFGDDLRHVAPWVPDLALRPAGLWRKPSGRYPIPDRQVDGPGPMGVAVHDALFREYANDEAEARQEAVQTTLRGIGRQTYARMPAITAAAGRLAHGRLNLSRCAQAWEQVFLAGGLRAAWIVALGTANIAAMQPRRPPGLSDLLRMLTSYVPEVPEGTARTVPVGLAALAAEKGSTKSHAEARRLVAALEAA